MPPRPVIRKWLRVGRAWRRISYHHLRSSVETDDEQLEVIVVRTLDLLSDLEQQFFGFQLQHGMLVPTHPEYWMIRNGEALVVARGVRAK